MDPFVNEKDFMLLNQDHYTFAVLMRILKGDCEIIRSNHENLLLCHSASHYPARKAMHCCNQNLTRHMSSNFVSIQLLPRIWTCIIQGKNSSSMVWSE